jgi:hypothetical protein
VTISQRRGGGGFQSFGIEQEMKVGRGRRGGVCGGTRDRLSHTDGSTGWVKLSVCLYAGVAAGEGKEAGGGALA